MSTLDDTLPFGPPGGEDAADPLYRRGARRLRATLAAAAFWVAVALPFLYVPLLASGVSSDAERTALATLLALNVATLYVGHGHRPGA
jgi:hypothetical protein